MAGLTPLFGPPRKGSETNQTSSVSLIAVPRLTDRDYLQRRQALAWLHRHRSDVVSYLSVRAQMDLHVYFQTLGHQY